MNIRRLVLKSMKGLKLAVSHPLYRRGLIHGVGAAIEHRQALHDLDIHHVLDIGANRGQFSLLARSLFPDASIHAYEPLKKPAKIFKNVFSTDPKTELHQCALGSISEHREIHVSKHEDSSSLLPILPLQSQIYAGTEETHTEKIEVKRGDTTFSETEHSGNILIKLDIQGFEMEALKGMPQILDKAMYVYAEISFMELYKGQVLADELITWLRKKHFKLNGLHNLSFTKSNQLIQADALFQKFDIQ